MTGDSNTLFNMIVRVTASTFAIIFLPLQLEMEFTFGHSKTNEKSRKSNWEIGYWKSDYKDDQLLLPVVMEMYTPLKWNETVQIIL